MAVLGHFYHFPRPAQHCTKRNPMGLWFLQVEKKAQHALPGPQTLWDSSQEANCVLTSSKKKKKSLLLYGQLNHRGSDRHGEWDKAYCYQQLDLEEEPGTFSPTHLWLRFLFVTKFRRKRPWAFCPNLCHYLSVMDSLLFLGRRNYPCEP